MNLGIVAAPEAGWMYAVEQKGVAVVEWASMYPVEATVLFVAWTAASTLFKFVVVKRSVTWGVCKWRGRKAA